MRNCLYAAWFVALAAGVFCITLFLEGLIRDKRVGQPDVAIDFASPGSTASHDFRVWKGGDYDVLVSSVNHSPPFDVPFKGRLEISVTGPDGRELVHRMVDSSSAHMRPNNMSWTPLDSLKLSRQILRTSRLSARVAQPDPQFRGVTTRVHLRLRQYDPGMGGLMNYVILIPGILFLAISLGAALSIAQRGGSSAS